MTDPYKPVSPASDLAGWIKICGITSAADARMAIDAGADAIGVNCWEHSPRCIPSATLAEIANTVSQSTIKLVLVTVNAGEPALRALLIDFPESLLQLHGDETPELVTALGGRVFKAVGLGEQADAERAKQFPGQFVLCDARDDIKRGGTGEAPPDNLVRQVCAARSTVLAGGLFPDTVPAAIERYKPFGVDVASGVERRPNPRKPNALPRKDPLAVRAFVTRARRAFSELAQSARWGQPNDGEA